MNSISKLIEQNIINFSDTLINNYYLLNLNETEVLILCKLYTLNKKDNKDLPIKELSNTMTLNENDLSMYIISLIERGYINIYVIDNHEEYDLNGVIEKLGNVLEVDNNGNNERKNTIESICQYLEQMCNRVTTTNDLIFINKWLDEERTVDEIKNGILSSVKLNKTNINYIDAVISSKNKKRETKDLNLDQEVIDILDGINVRKK